MKPKDQTPNEAASSAAKESRSRKVGEPIPDPSGQTDAGQTAISDDGPEALSKLMAENAELKDRLLRALAEVENVRRRAERDISDTRQYAITNFARDMLNVADNLGRAVASIPAHTHADEQTVKGLIEGVKLTERQLLRSLEQHEIKKLNPIGGRFDPHFHEAMFEVPDPSVPNGTVTEVVEPGYSIGSRVLRPAKVGVASGGPR